MPTKDAGDDGATSGDGRFESFTPLRLQPERFKTSPETLRRGAKAAKERNVVKASIFE